MKYDLKRREVSIWFWHWEKVNFWYNQRANWKRCEGKVQKENEKEDWRNRDESKARVIWLWKVSQKEKETIKVSNQATWGEE